jgi:phosphoserine/homoserine phosphotransferase
MHLVCLDLEGVLLPEFWIAVAERTGIPELRRTTRDEPDYDVLMRYRLRLLDKHGLTLPAIHAAIADLQPLPGAVELTQWLVSNTRLVILSDTFTQFAEPMMAKLGHPTLFCHELVVEPDGRIVDYRLRQPDQKRRAVEAFKALNFFVIAAGTLTTTSRCCGRDRAILFRPTDKFAADNADLPVTRTHADLRSAIEDCMACADQAEALRQA